MREFCAMEDPLHVHDGCSHSHGAVYTTPAIQSLQSKSTARNPREDVHAVVMDLLAAVLAQACEKSATKSRIQPSQPLSIDLPDVVVLDGARPGDESPMFPPVQKSHNNSPLSSPTNVAFPAESEALSLPSIHPTGSEKADMEKVYTKVFGVTKVELKRSTALRKMGLSEDDLDEANYLFSQRAGNTSSDEPVTKEEKMLGVSKEQVKRVKALKVLSATETDIDLDTEQRLGKLGIPQEPSPTGGGAFSKFKRISF